MEKRKYARYKDPQLLKEIRDWFRSDENSRKSANQLAQKYKYQILNSVLPALLRIGRVKERDREVAVAKELLNLKNKNVSPKMLRAFVNAVFLEKVAESEGDQIALAFPKDSSLFTSLRDLRFCQREAVVDFERKVRELSTHLSENLESLERQRLENFLMITALVFLAGHWKNYEDQGRAEALSVNVCQPLVKLYGLPGSPASYTRIRREFGKLAEYIVGKSAPEYDSNEFPGWWDAVLLTLKRECENRFNRSPELPKRIKQLPGGARILLAMDFKFVKDQSEKGGQVSSVESRLLNFKKATTTRKAAALNGSLGKLGGELEFLEKADFSDLQIDQNLVEGTLRKLEVIRQRLSSQRDRNNEP